MINFKKNIYLIFLCFFIATCDNENANDCIQTAGEIIQEEFTVNSFDEIIVNDKIELYIIDSTENKIVVETGENFLPDIELKVNTTTLEITNHNACFYYKDFGPAKVYVYTSDLKKIRNSSSFAVYSIGALSFPTLNLISENHLSEYLNSGDFNLTLNNTNLSIVDNGYSIYTIDGTCTNLNINFASNGPRFEGENLLVNNAHIFNRGANDILLNASNNVSGGLYSTGNVILYNEPLVNTLEAFYTGKIIVNY